MAWWQTFVVALGSSLAGGALTLWGSWWTSRAEERASRRKEAARLVGVAMAALREVDPDVWQDRLARGRGARELMEQKRDGWLAAAGGLDVLRTMYAGCDVAKFAEQVIRDGRLVVIRLEEQVGVESTPDQPWWTAVGGAYKRAIEGSDALLRAVLRENGRYAAPFPTLPRRG